MLNSKTLFKKLLILAVPCILILTLIFPYQADAQPITVSGTVFTDEGITPMADGRTVRLKANGVGDYSDTLNSGDGTYIITNIPAEAGTTLTVFLDGATEKGRLCGIYGLNEFNVIFCDAQMKHIHNRG